MPIYLEWGDPEKTSLIFRFVNPWAWTEFYEIRPQAEDMALQSGRKVGAIILLPEKLSLPQGALTQGRAIANTRPNHIPVSVIVSKSPMVASLVRDFQTS